MYCIYNRKWLTLISILKAVFIYPNTIFSIGKYILPKSIFYAMYYNIWIFTKEAEYNLDFQYIYVKSL